MKRDAEDGVVLINVLVVLALAATVVYTMLSVSEIAVARSQRFSEAGQGLALIRGGEQSAISALRRDLIEAPDVDYHAEGWGAVEQQAIEIAGGSFELMIEDAQGLQNLNALPEDALAARETLSAILVAADLAPDLAESILASLETAGPLRRLEDLRARVGLAPDEIAALGTLATALPGKGEVNINAAPFELLAILLKDPAQARSLVIRRDRSDFLTPQDLAAAGVPATPGLGFRSDLFRLRTTVRVGDTVQSVESLLRRAPGPTGPEVVVIRRTGSAARPVESTIPIT